eukprot:scaffold167437_cov30-Tisochrysis_lutea.AAC.3
MGAAAAMGVMVGAAAGTVNMVARGVSAAGEEKMEAGWAGQAATATAAEAKGLASCSSGSWRCSGGMHAPSGGKTTSVWSCADCRTSGSLWAGGSRTIRQME